MGLAHIVLPILVGAVIGYFTNSIAIKMLFRPHRAIYIGKHQLPFTPGIIPKNQKRLADAVGDAVSGQLLTKEAVLESLGDAGERYITKIAADVFDNETSIIDLLPREADSDEIVESVSAALSRRILEKVKTADIDAIIAQVGREALSSLVSGSPMLAMLFNADTQNVIYEKLGNAIRDYIDNHGEDAVTDLVSSHIRELADKPVGELISNEEDRDRLRAALENAVKNALANHGAEFLDQIDIRGIVSKRIEAMDVDELEDLVMSVMKQELQAVINLGAVIGAVIGVINVFL